MSTLQAPRRTRQPRTRREATPAVSADQVRQMLLEITFALHATRAVGRRGGAATRKG